MSQLLNLSLRASKKFNEQETVEWTKKIAKYAVFVDGTVDADGNLFREEDKERLVSFYEGACESEAEKEMAVRLKAMINLTEDFVPPIEGIDGLLGKVKGMQSVDGSNDDNKKWAWG